MSNEDFECCLKKSSRLECGGDVKVREPLNDPLCRVHAEEMFHRFGRENEFMIPSEFGITYHDKDGSVSYLVLYDPITGKHTPINSDQLDVLAEQITEERETRRLRRMEDG
jgi:hypothetical protein